MNELSLFTGAGGGLLGTHGLLGWRCRGYVEFNDYCQRVIRQRIDDGILDEAPIFTDVREFVESGAAGAYRGYIDVVTGGFPCQPFSVAGKQLADDDPRDMWPATIGVIRAIRPRFAFLENVPGLLAGSHGYFGRVLGDLADAGYDARWCVLGGKDVDGPDCVRERLWVLAFSTSVGRPEVVHGSPRECNSSRHRQSSRDGHTCRSPIERLSRLESICGEPGISRSLSGVAHRVDRLKAIGNGQVPLVAAVAWEILSGELR